MTTAAVNVQHFVPVFQIGWYRCCYIETFFNADGSVANRLGYLTTSAINEVDAWRKCKKNYNIEPITVVNIL